MRCSNCGSDNPDNSKFCGRCGSHLQIVYEKKNDKKKHGIIIFLLIVIICLLGAVLFKLAGFDFNIVINRNDNSKISQSIESNSSDNNSKVDDSKVDNSKVYNSNENNNSSNRNHINNYTTIEPKSHVLSVTDEDCTSILHDSFKKDYGPYKVLDGQKSTVWSEGVAGYGYGESITLYFNNVYTIKKLKIVNGLVNSYNGYYNNNRARTLKLYFSDGSVKTAYLNDDDTSYQTVNIDGNVKSSYVKIMIESVYSGTKYDDTCIAEVEVWGY